MELKDLHAYDCETYPNCFTLYIGNAETRKCMGFEISDRKDDRKAMIQYLRKIKKAKGWMVGFNNIGFDYPVLHFILKNQDCTVRDIYDKAMEIIGADEFEKWDHIIPAKKVMIPQIDLFKIHHFDNKARATSLKMIEFNMRSNDIEDLPYKPGTELDSKQIGNLLKYNKHDMFQTYLFLLQSIKQINFREELTKKYDRDFMNHNDGKIGKDYFIMKLEEEIPGSCYDTSGPRRKIRQTKRESINLEECILDYVHFDRPEFQAVVKWLKEQNITETKGVFNDILEHELGDLAKYAAMVTKKKKLPKEPTEKEIKAFKKDKPLCWIDERVLKSGKTSWYLCWNIAENLNTVVNGFRYDFGTGGIHGSVESTILYSDDEYVIDDRDVASFYPNLAISNRVYPEHLGESFCDIYLDVYLQRKGFKKGTPENGMLKLALNSVYGDSNNRFSPFYDPKYTMTITINGQLSLCMLAEKLLDIPTLEMVQVNTDGLTFRVKRKNQPLADEVCKEWEEITKLELEGVNYKMMAIRDVNSYLSVKESGGIKRVGAYCWRHTMMDDADLGWNQNHSALIVPYAAEKALVDGVPIEETIINHTDKMDFMLRTKVPRSSRLIAEKKDTEGNVIADKQLQNTCRYYVSVDGDGELVKIMPPLPQGKPGKQWIHPETSEKKVSKNKTEENRFKKLGFEFEKDVEIPPEERRIGIQTGWQVRVCNNINDFNGGINYDYYIKEAEKLVKPLLDSITEKEEDKCH